MQFTQHMFSLAFLISWLVLAASLELLQWHSFCTHYCQKPHPGIALQTNCFCYLQYSTNDKEWGKVLLINYTCQFKWLLGALLLGLFELHIF